MSNVCLTYSLAIRRRIESIVAMKFLTWPVILVSFAAVAWAGASTPAARWEPAIAAFEEADRESFPPAGGILFIGSSSIRGWRSLEQDFPEYHVVNRGFGGAWVSDCTHFHDRIVVPYSPEVIVFYAGENDLNGGTAPEVIRDNFQRFVQETRDELGDTHVAFISMKPSPRRWHLTDGMREGNAMIRDLTRTDDKLSYIDVFDPMLGSDGTPREELFVGDELHMNATGYALWTEIVGEHLREIEAPKKPE